MWRMVKHNFYIIAWLYLIILFDWYIIRKNIPTFCCFLNFISGRILYPIHQKLIYSDRFLTLVCKERKVFKKLFIIFRNFQVYSFLPLPRIKSILDFFGIIVPGLIISPSISTSKTISFPILFSYINSPI